MTDGPAIAVVVLNYNQKTLTASCAESLLHSDYPQLTILVVDNGSTDASADYLRGRFPQLEIVENPRNMGFAGGNNVGLRRILAGGSDLVWLLNNDTEVAGDCASQLAHAAMAHPDVALFAPKIYYHDHPRVLWYGGGQIRLHRPQGATHFGFGAVDTGQFDREQAVTFLSGCAMIVRRTALQDIGLLDEGMFAYYEDLDWCIRAQRTGYRALYVPAARLWHHGSRTTLANPRGEQLRAYLLARNRFIIQRRYRSVAAVIALLPRYLASRSARSAYRAFLAGRPQQSIAMLRGILAGVRGRSGDPPGDWL